MCLPSADNRLGTVPVGELERVAIALHVGLMDYFAPQEQRLSAQMERGGEQEEVFHHNSDGADFKFGVLNGSDFERTRTDRGITNSAFLSSIGYHRSRKLRRALSAIHKTAASGR